MFSSTRPKTASSTRTTVAPFSSFNVRRTVVVAGPPNAGVRCPASSNTAGGSTTSTVYQSAPASLPQSSYTRPPGRASMTKLFGAWPT